VLNYGMPDLSGNFIANFNLSRLERAIRQAIWDFEPRLIRSTVSVRALPQEKENHNKISFEIEADMWAQPYPERLYLKTELDLEHGSVTLVDTGARSVMNPRFLRYYSQELQHLREMGGEFAKDYPKIAGRLGLDSFECADPYVERLLEGFSFLAARVQMKIDAEFPRFTQHLAELVYPQLLAPTPSMAVAELQPDLSNPALQKGFVVKRGSAMRSVLGKGDNTACEYRSAHELTCGRSNWPKPASSPSAARRPACTCRRRPRPASGCACAPARRRSATCRWTACVSTCAAPMRCRCSFTNIAGQCGRRAGDAGGAARRLANAVAQGCAAAPRLRHRRCTAARGWPQLRRLPPAAGIFRFPAALPVRRPVRTAVRTAPVRRQGSRYHHPAEPQRRPAREVVDRSHFALHCTPVVNLFERRADRINLSGEQLEYHVLVDRTRPMDYEVFQVRSVTGYGSGPGAEQAFQPFYTARDLGTPNQDHAFYQVRREPRVLSQRQRRDGPRSSYVGSETFIAIVDAANAPYSSELRQLGLTVWCTNRDLPLSMPTGVGKTDFLLEAGAPVTALRCVAGPSAPRPSLAEGGTAWRLLNHLSLNYLSLLDADPKQGAVALREMLALYCHPRDLHAQRQVDGLRSISARSVARACRRRGRSPSDAASKSA
jgi:type VI secretion system protein ImpG